MKRALLTIAAVVFAPLALGLLLKFVVPMFANLFFGLGVPLPTPRIILLIATFLLLGIGMGWLAFQQRRHRH